MSVALILGPFFAAAIVGLLLSMLTRRMGWTIAICLLLPLALFIPTSPRSYDFETIAFAAVAYGLLVSGAALGIVVAHTLSRSRRADKK
jgi:hypothetical protein